MAASGMPTVHRLRPSHPVPLDHQFRSKQARDAYPTQPHLTHAGRACIEGLDEPNLYVPSLTRAPVAANASSSTQRHWPMRSTKALSPALPRTVLDGFLHINLVLRCNRFEPGDANFLCSAP
jgi:hypothetical protein